MINMKSAKIEEMEESIVGIKIRRRSLIALNKLSNIGEETRGAMLQRLEGLNIFKRRSNSFL